MNLATPLTLLLLAAPARGAAPAAPADPAEVAVDARQPLELVLVTDDRSLVPAVRDQLVALLQRACLALGGHVAVAPPSGDELGHALVRADLASDAAPGEIRLWLPAAVTREQLLWQLAADEACGLGPAACDAHCAALARLAPVAHWHFGNREGEGWCIVSVAPEGSLAAVGAAAGAESVTPFELAPADAARPVMLGRVRVTLGRPDFGGRDHQP